MTIPQKCSKICICDLVCLLFILPFLLHNLIFFAIVVGGAENMRRYWNNFITDTCVLVFVVDSTDSEKRLSLAFDEFHKLLGDDRLKKIPFVIVAAKQVCLLIGTHYFYQSCNIL